MLHLFVFIHVPACRRCGRVHNCRIPSGPEGYNLTPQRYFEDIYTLIQHYQDSPMVYPGFELCLTDAMPQPDPHLKEG